MKHNLWIALLAVSSLGLWSCTQDLDDPTTTDPNTSISGTAGYLGFQLEDAEASSRSTHKEYDDDYERFEWFNKGTANERAIIDNSESNRVLFFNSDYSYYGSGKLSRPEITGLKSNIYVAQKPLEVEGLPAYALVVLNADPERMDVLDTDLYAAGTSAVKTVLNYINEVDTDNPESLAMYDGHFTMSSTAYRGEEVDTISVLTPLNPAGPVFYETVEEAVMPENLTTFYVERLLSKFTLIIKDGNRRFNTTDAIIINGPNKLKIRQEYAPADGLAKDIMSDWKINLVNWGINGLEKNTYLVKTLVENPVAFPWDLKENFYIGWNSPTLYRSYWALDENYSTGIYPDQYRQALDVEGVLAATTNNIYTADYSATEGLAKGDYTLIYKPYNAYTDRTENKYSLENTFDVSVMNDQDIASQPWLRCGTHIILTAQFIVNEIDKDVDLTNVDATGFISGVADKYFSNGLYWSEKALKEQAIATLMTNIYYNKKGDQIADVVNGGFVEYINSDEHVLDDVAPVADGEGNALTHEELAVNADKYFEFGPAFIKGGDGWVSLKKKDDVTLKARYINKDTGEITLGEITDAQLVSYIYRFTNLAKHYKEGRMYYALPIRHNLESESFESNPVTTVVTGDYGVVRNTWYRLTINSIQRPGTPVDDPDQPIIPNPEPDDKSLGVEVEILPWRTVEINVNELH
ncbi:MAG: Mfa1 fimbrilin C-terminal domain-containing protein [Muribaculaceae bacterium]|nr:Mfa1 fimbrilin C-terminal domain-containing protein [Muribaculaceae bacterium]